MRSKGVGRGRDRWFRNPHLLPWRPRIENAARITDAELITFAVVQALLGFNSERRWLRHVSTRMARMFPTPPGQSGYNKRLCKLPVGVALTRAKAEERGTFRGILDATPAPVRPGQIMLTDEGYVSREFENELNIAGVTIHVLQRLLALTAAIWHNHNTPASPSYAPALLTTSDPLESLT